MNGLLKITALILGWASIAENAGMEFFYDADHPLPMDNETNYVDVTNGTLPSSSNCSCPEGFCDATKKCMTCKDQNSDSSTNCSTCLDGYILVGHVCEDLDECKFPKLYCPKGPTVCSNTNGSFRCICQRGFALDTEKLTCRIISQMKLKFYLPGKRMMPDLGDPTTDIFRNLAAEIALTFNNLLSISSIYIKVNLENVSQQETGVLMFITIDIWNRKSADIDRLTTEIEKYLLTCKDNCFHTLSAAFLIETKILGPCRINSSLCSTFEHTICSDQEAVHVESMNNQYTCGCENGFTGDTSFHADGGTIFVCKNIQSHCASNPCLSGGTCMDFTGGYKCDCPWSHTGLICEKPLPLLLVIATCLMVLFTILIVVRYACVRHKQENVITITKRITNVDPSRDPCGSGIVNESFVPTELASGSGNLPRAKLKDPPAEEEMMERSF